MSITGVLKVIDTPQDVCITTTEELVKSLPRYLAVEFGAEKITNVIVSATEPDTTDRDVIWHRVDNSGNFVGIFEFVQGQWIQVLPTPRSLSFVYGRSDDLPTGFALADSSFSALSAGMAAKLKEQWYPTDPSDGVYTLFHVVYVGV